MIKKRIAKYYHSQQTFVLINIITLCASGARSSTIAIKVTEIKRTVLLT